MSLVPIVNETLSFPPGVIRHVSDAREGCLVGHNSSVCDCASPSALAHAKRRGLMFGFFL